MRRSIYYTILAYQNLDFKKKKHSPVRPCLEDHKSLSKVIMGVSLVHYTLMFMPSMGTWDEALDWNGGKTTMIFTYVLNSGPAGVHSPLDNIHSSLI
jgi:hypothetical protein